MKHVSENTTYPLILYNPVQYSLLSNNMQAQRLRGGEYKAVVSKSKHLPLHQCVT